MQRRLMRGRGWIFCLLGLVLCLVATAPIAQLLEDNNAVLRLDPEAAASRAFVTDRDLGIDNEHWAAFTQTHPGDWRTQWDMRTGIPTLIWGPGIQTSGGALDENAVMGIAYDLIEENIELLGLSGFDFEGEPSHAGGTWYLELNLVRDAIPFDFHSRVDFRVKDNGVVMAIKSNQIPKSVEPSEPTIDAASAVDIALGSVTRFDRSDLSVSEPELLYITDTDGIGRLAWRFEVRNSDKTDPFGKAYIMRARERATAVRVDELIHYDHSGSVSANTIVGGTNDPPVSTLLPEARVTITSGGSGSTFTNSNGLFNFAGVGSRTIRARLDGRWSNVQNQAGADAEQSINAGEGDNFHFDLNTTTNEFPTAEATCFYWVTETHRYSSFIMGGNNGVEYELTTNVNINSNCNAFWDGSSINMYRAGSGCPNTGHDASIIAHEYGHGMDAGRGGIVNGAYSEGFGDAVGMGVTDQHCSGVDFGGPGNCGRSGEDVRLWPAPECGGQVHCLGSVYAQFTWQMTKALKLSLGEAAGRQRADRLILLPAVANPVDIPDAVLETFIADDNNGDINDGTPNFSDIASAADSRNLPRPILPDAVFTYPNDRPDYSRPGHLTRFRVDVTAGVKTPVADTGVLSYRTGGGAFTDVPMTETGANQYEALLPRAVCGTGFEYYVSVDVSEGGTVSDPSDAPASFYSSEVFSDQTIVLDDDFESNQGWTVVNVALTDGAWIRGIPAGGGTRGDPPTDGDGSGRCFVTDNVAGNSDVDGGPTQLISPTLDFSSGDGTVAYLKWHSNDDNDDPFTTFVSNNDGASWTQVSQVVGGNGGWDAHSFTVGDFVTPTSLVKVRFDSTDNPNDSVTESGVDGFKASTSDCDEYKLTMTQSPLIRGTQITWTVTGCLPFSEVRIIGTKQGVGSGECVAEWGDLCIDLNPNVKRLPAVNANGAGVAVITRNLPLGFPAVEVATQAVNVLGADSTKSTTIVETVQ